jgi:hypothetical protein
LTGYWDTGESPAWILAKFIFGRQQLINGLRELVRETCSRAWEADKMVTQIFHVFLFFYLLLLGQSNSLPSILKTAI